MSSRGEVLAGLSCVYLALALLPTDGLADDLLGPSDPIAAVDGKPILMGELNLILSQRLGLQNLDRISIDIQQATALLLIRRRLAMISLESEGGTALQSILDREIESFAVEAKRRGSSLAQMAKAQQADEKSLVADLRWRAAWSRYLKSRLDQTNLRRYYQAHRDRYAGGRWEVSQIFIQMDASDAKSVREATVKINELADLIGSSSTVAESFAAAATEHSEAGSASAGGKLGWVEKDGDLPRAVMDAVRETPVGNISEPVRSPLGMHLIYVNRFEANDQGFEELTDRSQLQRDAADALFDALIAKQSDAKIVWFVPALRRADVSPIRNQENDSSRDSKHDEGSREKKVSGHY